MSKPPFFVVGVGRSGTTLLRLMLHHHPGIAIPYESHFLTRYIDRIAEYEPLDRPGAVRRLLSDMLAEKTVRMWDHTFDLDRLEASVAAPTLRDAVEAIYRDYARAKGKPRWGDKSDYLERMHVLHRLFPDALFVHIIRDGRDVARSVMKLAWGPKDVVSAAEWWNDHVWVARRMGAILGEDRYLEVRYEALVTDPEHELRRVCAFLGEDYAPEMLAYHADADSAIPAERRHQHTHFNEAPDPSRTFAWKRDMDPCDVALFNRHARRMLGELGYELPDVRVGEVRLAWRLLRLYATRYVRHRSLASASPRS
jgi:hypothetical protein